MIYFYDKGGIDVGDVDAKAVKLLVPTGVAIATLKESVLTMLLKEIKDPKKKNVLLDFIERLFTVYVDLNFTYLEINPLVVLDPSPTSPTHQVIYLDLAAKIDQTGEFESGKKWSQAITAPGESLRPLSYPAPFGRELTREESYIADLDAKTGASLKLTVLNATGRVWTMVAGGGASVVYRWGPRCGITLFCADQCSDAIAAHGFAHELANYGEYSGAPSEGQTFEYAKTVLDLMTRGAPNPKGKVLIVGGGIANFTNVAATFKGIVRAFKEFKQRLIKHNVSIYVRRGGPNYQEGLKLMRDLGETLGVPIHVFGPETHITAIVPMALGLTKLEVGGERLNGVFDLARKEPRTDKLLSIKSSWAKAVNLRRQRSARPIPLPRWLNSFTTRPKSILLALNRHPSRLTSGTDRSRHKLDPSSMECNRAPSRACWTLITCANVRIPVWPP